MSSLNTYKSLRGLILSAVELKNLTGLPDAFVEDYLSILNSLASITKSIDNIKHSNLSEVLQADPSLSDTEPEKHVTNAQLKKYEDHVDIINGNPHGTDWDMLEETASYIPMNISPTGVPTSAGTISWDEGERSPQFETGLGNTVTVNKEIWDEMVNKTGATALDGLVVYHSGTQGKIMEFKLADAALGAKCTRIGMLTTSSSNNGSAAVTFYGRVHGLDTSAFNDNDKLYLKADGSGGYSTTPPAYPAFRLLVGTVTRAHPTLGEIFVDPRLDFSDGITFDTLYLITQLLATKITSSTLAPTDLVVDCGTEKTIRLEEPVWKDIDFPIVIRITGPNIPTLSTVLGNLTMPQWAVNDLNVCEIQEITHEWEEGTNIYWHIHIVTAVQDATDRYVNWEIEFNYANIYIPSMGGAYDSSMSWQGANTTVTSGNSIIPANTPIHTNIIIPINTWAYTAGKIGGHVKARLRRIAVTGGVAEPSVAPFCEMLQMHILCDTMGSRKIGTK